MTDSQSDTKPVTIIVPTRDGAESCRRVLETLTKDNRAAGLELRVLFLANDTSADATAQLLAIAADPAFASLQPKIRCAKENYPAAEQNFRWTLGDNLGAVEGEFLVIGNSDQVELPALRDAVQYLREHRLDLLLVGIVNREAYQGQPVRQCYASPRHVNPKNLLPAEACHGAHIFASAMRDYGPADYLAYFGCQIYTKHFFRELCGVLDSLPEPIYGFTIATLELTTRREWAIGFWPEAVAVRVDHLHTGPNSAQQPPDWWMARSRTERGLSSHILQSLLANSVHLSERAFTVMVNSQKVAMERGAPRYHFSNFLYALVQQTAGHLKHSHEQGRDHLSDGERADLASFGERLQNVDVGLPQEHRGVLCAWFHQFSGIENLTATGMQEVIASAQLVLGILDQRCGMERWTAELSTWSFRM